MKKDVHTVTLRHSVQEVLLLSHRLNVSGFPVMDDGGKVIGVVSTIDLIIDAAVDKLTHKLGELPLLIAAEKRVIKVHPDAPVKEALLTMVRAGVGRVLVIDETGKLCGIVTRSDLVGFIVDTFIKHEI